MKIIKKNDIKSITASSAASAYPVTNLLNSAPKKKWKAASSAVTNAVLDVKVDGQTGALGMVAVIADELTVSISDPNGIEWEDVTWFADGGQGTVLDPDYNTALDPDELTPLDPGGESPGSVVWVTSPDNLNVKYTWQDTGEDYRNLWVSFEQFNSPVTISVSLRKDTGTPETLAAGVLVIGDPIHIPNVQYPLTEGLIDYSITDQLSNGAIYYKKKDIVRYFYGSARVVREPYFQTFMRGIARLYGLGSPMMINFSDAETSKEFVLYGRLSAMPEGSHDTYSYSVISFSFIEVL